MPEQQSLETPWRRVHWASPIIRFWIFLFFMAFTIVREFVEDALEGDGFHAPDAGALAGIPVKALLIVGGIVALVVGFMYLSWRMNRYRITEDHIELQRGVLFRTRDRLRLDRIQSIDLEQPLLARILGLAAVKFVTADGEGTFTLEFLSASEARRLRTDLLVAAEDDGAPLTPEAADLAEAVQHPAGDDVVLPDGTAARREEGGEVVFHLSPQRAIASYFLRLPILLAILVIIAGQTLHLLPWAWAQPTGDALKGLSVPIILGVGGSALGTLPKRMNYTIRREGHRLVLAQGLASTAARGLRTERIHGLSVSQPLLWRIPGWYEVTVTVPGGSSDGDSALPSSQLLPAATRAEVEDVLGLALPEMLPALAGFLPRDDDGFTRAAKATRWFNPLSYPRLGFAVEDGLIAVRGGRLNRTLDVFPIRRIQQLEINQGPIQRLFRVASVKLGLVGSIMNGHLPDQPVREAEAFFHEARELTQHAAEQARIPLRAGKDYA